MTGKTERPAAAERGKPPVGTRFCKDQSGNPKGGPRGTRNKMAPYEMVLGQMVTVRIDNVERRLTAAEAFMLYMMRRGLDGDTSAARATLDAIEMAPSTRNDDRVPDGPLKPWRP